MNLLRAAPPTAGRGSSGAPARTAAASRGPWRPGLPYLPGLDGVRALAVAAVLLFHLPARLLPGGFLGVDVFFVLSGFLITSLLLAELERSGRVSFGSFYLARARRLLPALFAVLVVTSVLVLTVARDAAEQFSRDVLAALTYSTNWWYVVDQRSYFELLGRPPMLQHLWSLAVEEQFYLLWPSVVLVVWRFAGRRALGAVALAGALASTAWMSVLASSAGTAGGADASRLYFGSDTHAMTILAGAALATLWRPARMSSSLPRRRSLLVAGLGWSALIVLAAVFLTVGQDTAWLYHGGFAAVAAVTAVLVLAASHPGAGFGRQLGNPVMRWLGTRSYGIYLWHWPIFLVTRPDLDLPYGGWAAAATSLALTGLAAEGCYRWVETPVRRGALAQARRRFSSAALPRRLGTAAVGMVAASALVACGVAVAAVPPVTAVDYLGGVTSMGAGALGGGEEPRVQPAHRGRPGPAASSDRQSTTAPPTSPLSTSPLSTSPLSTSPGQTSTRTPITAVGDSVLLGARSAVQQVMPKVTIDAAVSRQPYDIIARVKERLRAGALADVLVLEAGTNGIPDVNDLHDLLVRLHGLDRIVLVNVRSPVPWMDASNRALREAAGSLPNVVVADWAAASAGHHEYFVPDGTHLTTQGSAAYARTIAAALG